LVGGSSGSYISNCYATGNVNGTSDCGGVAGTFGSSYHDIMTACYFIGKVSATNNSVGGLIGSVEYSTISNCYAIGSVSGAQSVGGLIGQSLGGCLLQEPYNNTCTIFNCCATNSVRGHDLVGGLVGFMQSDICMVIRNCVSANDSVIGTGPINPFYGTNRNSYVNRIVGYKYDLYGVLGGTLQNNYALNTMVVQNQNGNNVPIVSHLDSASGFSIPMDSLKSFAFYNRTANWYQMPWNIQNPSGIWKICDGVDLPFLRWQDISCNYAISATTGKNGSISPAGTVIVVENTNQTFTFSATNCYTVDSLWIDGIYKPDSIAKGSYTFKNINENHSIKVSFKRLPPDTVIIKDTICYGANYAINGFNVPTAIADSVYFNNDFNQNGCDSVIRLELTVNPIYIVPIVATICKGNVYDFHEKLLTEKGIYTDTLQTISGCDSVIELTLTVISIDTTHISESICEGESYDFFGRLLTEEDIYYKTLQSIHGCDSIIELRLTVTVGIVETQLIASLPRIYPNPTTGKLTIRNEKSEVRNVEIYDVYGKKQLSIFNLQFSVDEIDISHLANGMYFLKIGEKRVKVVKN